MLKVGLASHGELVTVTYPTTEAIHSWLCIIDRANEKQAMAQEGINTCLSALGWVADM